MSRGDAQPVAPGRVRLDKWLWAARFYKTRTLAAQAIDAGQVRVGGERVKPAHSVRAGDRVSLRKGGLIWDVTVRSPSDRRGSATDAAELYDEAAESIETRKRLLLERKAANASVLRFAGRPSKRDRRKLDDFLNEG